MNEVNLDVNLVIKAFKERIAQDAEEIATLKAMNVVLANELAKAKQGKEQEKEGYTLK